MTALEKIQNKILSPEKLTDYLLGWKQNNLKLVFTNGCFDLLHTGHIHYLAEASEYGDLLIIGLNTDESVEKLKGLGRPVTDEYSRAIHLAALQFVDYIVLFDEDTPYDLIKTISPNFLIKGSDYKPENIVGYDILKAGGGQIITIDFIEGYSSTSIIERIKSL